MSWRGGSVAAAYWPTGLEIGDTNMQQSQGQFYSPGSDPAEVGFTSNVAYQGSINGRGTVLLIAGVLVGIAVLYHFPRVKAAVT